MGGDPAKSMCFLVSGRLKIARPRLPTGTQSLFNANEYLEAPSWIGDMCLFQDCVRVSTVISAGHAELLVLRKSSMLEIIENCKSAWKLYIEYKQKMDLGDLSGAGITCAYCEGFGHSAADCPNFAMVMEGS